MNSDNLYQLRKKKAELKRSTDYKQRDALRKEIKDLETRVRTPNDDEE